MSGPWSGMQRGERNASSSLGLRRRRFTSIGAGFTCGGGAAGAAIRQASNAVQDNGEARGFPVRWNIELTIDITRFFDRDGALEPEHLQIRDEHDHQPSDTGLPPQEGPDELTTAF